MNKRTGRSPRKVLIDKSVELGKRSGNGFFVGHPSDELVEQRSGLDERMGVYERKRGFSIVRKEAKRAKRSGGEEDFDERVEIAYQTLVFVVDDLVCEFWLEYVVAGAWLCCGFLFKVRREGSHQLHVKHFVQMHRHLRCFLQLSFPPLLRRHNH